MGRHHPKILTYKTSKTPNRPGKEKSKLEEGREERERYSGNGEVWL